MAWTKCRIKGLDRHEQLEWTANVMEYVSYVSDEMRKKTFKKEAPLLGPRFIPPSYLHQQQRNPAPDVVPSTAYLRTVHIIHPLYYPSLSKCPQCDSDDISWQGWTTTGPRDVHGISQEETAIGVQLKCNKCIIRFGGKNPAEQGTYCFATTNAKFWERKEHWELPRKSVLEHYTVNDKITYNL